ncbi:MAG: hypothetical protein ABJB95_01115 [Gemmatimonadales bacterium]
MRSSRLASVLGSSAIMLCCLAMASAAQNAGRQRAPVVRIYSLNGAYTLTTTKYVSPAIEVSENAYIFAVSMDLDGQIQVLHPDFPGISVRMLAHKSLHLPNFFAGFGQGTYGGGRYSMAANRNYDTRYGTSADDSRGTVIALASRAPFNLELIERGGDWDMSAIRRLIEYRSPQSAAQMLAAYLGAKGEPIGRDYLRFGGGQSDDYGYDYAYAYSACDFLGHGFSYWPSRGFRSTPYSGAPLGRGESPARIIGYDVCGLPIIGYGPTVVTRPPVPTPRPPGDTTVFPKGRFPKDGFPRVPKDGFTNASAEGIFPIPRRSGLPQMGDVTIKAPERRRGEPSQIIDAYRSQPGGGMTVPQGRIPIDRAQPRTEPTAPTGVQPPRTLRNEPRTESPPPARAPERPRESPPAPVVHERPSTPAPPPPRAEVPATKMEPVRVPPPNLK